MLLDHADFALDSNLSAGQSYLLFEQLEPEKGLENCLLGI